MKYVLFVVLFLFITSCASTAPLPVQEGRILVETPPTYTVGERSPIVFRDVGDIGVDPRIPAELINSAEVPYQQVSGLEDDIFYITHYKITGERTQVEGYHPKSGQRAYYDGENFVLVTSYINYPLREGDYFGEHQKTDTYEIISHCGPVRKDEKSGYIFFECYGSIVGEEVDLPGRVVVLTKDLKWQVMPMILIPSKEQKEKLPVVGR